MHLDRIVGLANKKSKLQFTAMERSLRASGCQLPLAVIPYDDDLFDLPKNSRWWKLPELWDWLRGEQAHPMMYKYQCLTIKNYQYVDCDICFLTNPEKALEPYSGWVVACTDWNKPQWTYTEASANVMYRKSSTWQRSVFNAGQFACDRALYALSELQDVIMRPDMVDTCLRYEMHDQPGMNLLVFNAKVPVTNLTLPPYQMQSTWAGDYPGEYQHLWADEARKPYLIHWAGPTLGWDRPINEIFYSFLTRAERAEWDEQQRVRRLKAAAAYRAGLPVHRRATYDLKRLAKWGLNQMGVDIDKRRVARRALAGELA
jgi:hypothetical protein